ncbi:acyl-CoA thioesterase [Longirhabdus pacifica]|uniref:acyl-CoA thioesterase n=1 Tax=Longirhabdus pacifica TaxID=2305227 RepID=UPI001009167F
MEHHTFEIDVRSTEIDTLGHVNNAKYLEYMEWARFDWIQKAGLTVEKLREKQIMIVLVNVNINYRKEIRFGDKVKVVTKPVKPTRVGGKSGTMIQEIYNQHGDLATDAEITIVFIDAVKRKSIEIPEEIIQAAK